jgi:CDP-glycerol glycerophosphotransferase
VPFVRINKKKIVFCSYYGGNYSCNPKYITEELLKQNIDCEIVWLVDRKKVEKTGDFPNTVKIVDYTSICAFFELAAAGIWIDNCRKNMYPQKNKNQYYIQTWHGSVGNKRVEKHAINSLPKQYVKAAMEDALITDFCISNGSFMTNVYNNAFWYPNHTQVLEYGSPRNDILVNKTDFSHIKKKLLLDESTQVVLYAPTFRHDYSFDAYTIDYTKILTAIENKYGGQWVFLVKLHPNLISYINTLQIPDNIINVTLYPDIQELLSVTSILISDYSSVMFDFMFTRRPCFIFAVDYNDYKQDRGTYFPWNKSPFLFAENNDQLIENIGSFDYEKYNEKIDAFINHIGCFEHGNACQLVVNKIQDLMNIRPRAERQMLPPYGMK